MDLESFYDFAGRGAGSAGLDFLDLRRFVPECAGDCVFPGLFDVFLCSTLPSPGRHIVAGTTRNGATAVAVSSRAPGVNLPYLGGYGCLVCRG